MIPERSGFENRQLDNRLIETPHAVIDMNSLLSAMKG